MSTFFKSPIIEVKQGLLKGRLNEMKNGSIFYSFKGVPYAQPPVGNLRFKAPLPLISWDGVYEAIEHGPVCPQVDILFSNLLKGNEDCLYLNVYTKHLDPNTNNPVMVFFHGGGFLSGSGDDDVYGPEFLLQHDVILVTVNYRLEVLGFLCLDIPEVPGNAGLKDQVMALKWVQDNISQFGGDPKNVTIFGESAGGASVTYHILSPMSKGLFHKAITQSGTCLCDWALAKDPEFRAVRAAKHLGLESDNPKAILEYFQKIPALDFCKMKFKTATEKDKRKLMVIFFAPVVEKKFDNAQAFLDEEPIDLILKGKINKVPLIIGNNSNEGLLQYSKIKNKANFPDLHPYSLVPNIMENKLSNEEFIDLGNRIKAFYLNNEADAGFTKFLSDAFFNYNIYRFANFYANHSEPVYVYRFSCDTELNLFKMLIGVGDEKGASHADELFYLFSSTMSKNVCEGKKSLFDLIQKITKLWTNFAKTGNPTESNDLGVVWHPYNSNRKLYFDIGNQFVMKNSAEADRMQFWNSIYRQQGLPHITSSHL